MMPLNSATSPLTRTGKNRQAIGVPGPSIPSGSWGFLKRIMPASGNGFTLTILQPARGFLQLGEHPRVTSAWILTDDEDGVGVREVFDFHRGLADANRFGEPGAARFVAHVRAIRQVVGAELTREEPVEERRFVARAARSVKGRPRRGELKLLSSRAMSSKAASHEMGW